MDARETSLKAVIDAEPLNAGRTDAQVLAWLNASTTRPRDVEWVDMMQWMVEYDMRPQLVTASGSANARISSAAQLILDTITAGQPLYLSRAVIRQRVNGALPDGPAKDALVALGSVSAPRWQAEGLDERVVTRGHVAEVRRA